MPVSVIVTALVGEIGAVVAKEVAKMLAQDFLNLETIIENNLSKMVLEKYSSQDLLMIEQKQISLALQKKCVAYVPFEVFVQNTNLFASQKVFYVFVPKSALPKFDIVGQIAYEDRNKFLNQNVEKIDFFNFDIEKIACEIIKKVRTKQ